MKKKLQFIFKKISYKLFFIIYGKIKGHINASKNKEINIKKSILGDKVYNVYFVDKGRLYTDTINDTAIISNQKLIIGPSFQYRKNINVNSKKNIVYEKGTPRIKRSINGTVVSILSGGAGNSNYWHWLFDVLPRIKIAKNVIDNIKNKYLLVPSMTKKFQTQSLKLLKINKKKILPSNIFRHIDAKQIISTDHPYVFGKNPSKSIHNIPLWITKWLRKKFILKINKLQKKNLKIYIDRDNSEFNKRRIVNHKELLKFFKKEGFKIIKLEKLNFKKQIEYFYNAKIIVGLHGAGFANLVFAKKKTKILEIKSKTAGNVIKNLALKNQLSYKSLSIKPTIDFKNQFGEIFVSLDKLKKILYGII